MTTPRVVAKWVSLKIQLVNYSEKRTFLWTYLPIGKLSLIVVWVNIIASQSFLNTHGVRKYSQMLCPRINWQIAANRYMNVSAIENRCTVQSAARNQYMLDRSVHTSDCVSIFYCRSVQAGNRKSTHGPIGCRKSTHGPIGWRKSTHGPIGWRKSTHGPIASRKWTYGLIGFRKPLHGPISCKKWSHGLIGNGKPTQLPIGSTHESIDYRKSMIEPIGCRKSTYGQIDLKKSSHRPIDCRKSTNQSISCSNFRHSSMQ